MKLAEFVDKYAGKGIDFDKAFGNQCVDVFRQYCQDVVGSPHLGSVEGAKEIYTRFENLKEPAWFAKVPYVKWRRPLPGDVIVYDATPTNKYGHVAIVLYASYEKVVVLEQIGGDKTATDPSKVSMRTYANCLGWLHPFPEVL